MSADWETGLWDAQQLKTIHGYGGIGPTCARHIHVCQQRIEELEARTISPETLERARDLVTDFFEDGKDDLSDHMADLLRDILREIEG